MQPEMIIQILIGLLVTIIMAIVTTARSESQKDRNEILTILGELREHQSNLDTRLSILEHDFADIDPHPSRHKRPL